MSEITKTEREELRRLVRQQFKVLKSEVNQRAAELEAEAATTVLDKFTGLDNTRAHLEQQAQDIIDEANLKLKALCATDEAQGAALRGYHRLGAANLFAFNPDRRTELVAAAKAAIKADTTGAMLRLDRAEADLLRDLSVGALGSEAAQAFLGAIPTVGELVPAARLQELEASLADEELTREPNRWEL